MRNQLQFSVNGTWYATALYLTDDQCDRLLTSWEGDAVPWQFATGTLVRVAVGYFGTDGQYIVDSYCYPDLA